jgi:hypothetical protein
MPNSDDHDLRQDILRQLAQQSPADLLTRLCCLAVSAVPCADAVVVLEDRNGINGSVASCSSLGTSFAEAEFELGEGPTYSVRTTGRYQITSGLAERLPLDWPMLGARCTEFGIHAIASFPMQVGHAQLGAMHTLFTTREPLDAVGHESALVISSLLTDALLYLQSGLTEMDFIELLATSDFDRLRVHQATGMVAEMLMCSVGDAMAVMRARAFKSDITLYELSHRIVAREEWIAP